MAGKKNRYIYQMYVDDVLYDEGFSIDLAIKHDIDEYKFYAYWKSKGKLQKKYRIERFEKYPYVKDNTNEKLTAALDITIKRLIKSSKCPDNIEMCPKIHEDDMNCKNCWKESLNI